MLEFLKAKKEVQVMSPCKGEVVPVEEVPDPVFSKKMLGDGFAVIPTGDIVEMIAPISGKVVQIFPTNHAYGIEMKNGVEVLVHIGLDTVELKGEGFTRLVEEGQTVQAGTPIMKVDFSNIRDRGKNTITPVVFTSTERIKEMRVKPGTNPEITLKIK